MNINERENQPASVISSEDEARELSVLVQKFFYFYEIIRGPAVEKEEPSEKLRSFLEAHTWSEIECYLGFINMHPEIQPGRTTGSDKNPAKIVIIEKLFTSVTYKEVRFAQEGGRKMQGIVVWLQVQSSGKVIVSSFNYNDQLTKWWDPYGRNNLLA